jgi:hypothetical protein
MRIRTAYHAYLSIILRKCRKAHRKRFMNSSTIFQSVQLSPQPTHAFPESGNRILDVPFILDNDHALILSKGIKGVRDFFLGNGAGVFFDEGLSAFDEGFEVLFGLGVYLMP